MMDELVGKYTSYEQPDVTLAQFVKNNPWVLVALISIVVGVGAIILLIARNNSVLRSVAKERQIFADSLQENDNAEHKAGQLLLSYPSIESYIISIFRDITDLRFRLGKDAEAYIGNNEDIQLNKISENTLLNAAVEFLKYPENEKLTFDIDDFSAASHEVFSRQENEYL